MSEVTHDTWVNGECVSVSRDYTGDMHEAALKIAVEDYRKMRQMNVSTLIAGRKSMLHLHRVMAEGFGEPTAAMVLGTAIHCFLLDGEREFDNRYFVMPDFASEPENVTDTGKPSKSSATKYVKTKREEYAKQHEGKTEISNYDWRTIVQIDQALPFHCRQLIADSETEVTLTGKIAGVECKGRIDMLGLVLADLKTTASVEPIEFSRTFFRLGYDFKLAFYRELVRQNFSDKHVQVLAVEVDGDFDSVLLDIPASVLDNAFQEVEYILCQYKDCVASGKWPGVAGEEKSVELFVPNYMQKEPDLDWETTSAPSEVTIEDMPF